MNDTYLDILQFYHKEADMLDSWRELEWLGLLAPNFRYCVPIRSMKLRSGGWDGQYSSEGYHIDETLPSIEVRVRRLGSGIAYAADPPPRSRHFISNLRISPLEGENRYLAKTNVLLIRGEADVVETNFLSAERQDILLRDEGTGWKIEERVVYLDHTILPANNLALFF